MIRRGLRWLLGDSAFRWLVIALIFIAIIAAMTGASAGVRSDPDTVDFTGDFETGDLSQWPAAESRGSLEGAIPRDYQFRVVGYPVRQGRYAVEFVVHDGDRYGGSTGERALLRWLTSDSSRGSFEREGDSFYYGWSTLWPLDWKEPPQWGQIFEFHGDSRFPLAPLRLNAGGRTLRLDMTTGRCSPDGTGCAYDRNTTVLRSLHLGEWNDFVLHVVWTAGSGGLVELWHRVAGHGDWRRVTTLRGIPTLPSIPGQPPPTLYLLWGLYTGAGGGVRTLYGDNFVRGRTFEDVAATFPDPGTGPCGNLDLRASRSCDTGGAARNSGS